jgi:Cu+-exporting ATPase
MHLASGRDQYQEAPMKSPTTGTTPSPDAVDPVCGMTISPATAAASRDIAGTTYYFCSSHCANTYRQRLDTLRSAGPAAGG